MLKVIASQGPDRFVVVDYDDVEKELENPLARGRILDMERKIFFRPSNVHTVFTTNSWPGALWERATMSDERLQELLSQVEDRALKKP